MKGLRLPRRRLRNDDLVDLCESAASEEDLDKVMFVPVAANVVEIILF